MTHMKKNTITLEIQDNWTKSMLVEEIGTKFPDLPRPLLLRMKNKKRDFEKISEWENKETLYLVDRDEKSPPEENK